MTKNVVAYIRVSTNKQGDGVSLDAQTDVIKRYAESKQLNIIKWFKEKKSASKGNRPAFAELVATLYDKKADGCIFHKIDRISRNDLDWHTMNMLADAGYDIISASENINLRDMGARLTADIQAVIATNYSRNLSFEAKKGLYQRLKQGYFPFRAPVGYLDNGKGKFKTLDPLKAPLVKRIFELYTKKAYSVNQILAIMLKLGLTNVKGKPISLNGIFTILKNPFYAGIMKVKGQAFHGKHKALISLKMFERAKDILEGRENKKIYKHDYLLRRMMQCVCGYSLIGEKQKGRVYYRCHKKECPVTALREDQAEATILKSLKALKISEKELGHFTFFLDAEKKEYIKQKAELISSLTIQVANINMRLDKLTDVLIDGNIDKISYQTKRENLIKEQRRLQEQKEDLAEEKLKFFNSVRYYLELLKEVDNTYLLADLYEKRDLIKSLFSNLVYDGKKLCFATLSTFTPLINRDLFDLGEGIQGCPRTNFAFFVGKTSAIIPRKLSEKDLKVLYQRILQKVTLLDCNHKNSNELSKNNAHS